jgi:outer membrane lipoprotein-sorting protein
MGEEPKSKCKMTDQELKISKRCLGCWLLLLLLIILTAEPTFAITPQKILEKADLVRAPFESFVMDVELVSSDKKMNFRVYSKRGEDSLVIYLLPRKERGKLLLMKEESLWIYIPGTRRALRITPMQRLMGGVSNGDIARLRWSKDYDVRLLKEDQEIYELELTALKPGATYHRLELSIEKGSFKPIKAKVYLKSGKLYKTIYFTGFRAFAGKIMATELKFVDHLKADKETLMTFSNVEYKKIPDRYFHRTALPRLSETLSVQ